MKSIYIQKCEELKSLRRIYKDIPLDGLKEKIERLDKEIKEIDKMIGFRSTPGGRYKNSIKTNWLNLLKTMIFK